MEEEGKKKKKEKTLNPYILEILSENNFLFFKIKFIYIKD
jgi:hypothetical protein